MMTIETSINKSHSSPCSEAAVGSRTFVYLTKQKMVRPYRKTKKANIKYPLYLLSVSLAIWELLALICDNSNILVICQTADRKSTRLNSSHVKISYAVFCLKKKK